MPARYICALAAGDIKLEIREEGQSGLKPPKPQPGTVSAISVNFIAPESLAHTGASPSMCVLSHHSIICQGRLWLATDRESGETLPAMDQTAAFVFLYTARPHCATGRAGAAEIKVTYPQLAAMVSYIQDRHSALKQAAATGRGSLEMTKPLPLQPKAYLALISFLRECRKQNRNDSKSPSQSYLGNHSPS